MRGMTSMLLFAALAAGCQNDISVQNVETSLAITPALTDLGIVPVGEEEQILLQIDSLTGGDVTIRNVDVTNVDGDFFLSLDEDLPVIEGGGSGQLAFLYAPLEEGYHRATVTITNDSADNSLTVDMRAQAVAPSATVTPLALDFGPVEAGETEALPVTVRNTSDLTITVTGSQSTKNEFTVAFSKAQEIKPGKEFVFPVAFTASNDAAITGRITLKMGQVELPSVMVRANDCEGGDPTAYDGDADGYTICGATPDCDDTSNEVHSGVPELADGVDNDCDGVIDEGTENYDDDGDGESEVQGDCNDGDVDVFSGATEDLTNGVDDDCDGVVDQGTSDTDGDGYAPDATNPAQQDCDDSDPARYPFAPEIADGKDNDCDLLVDEGTEAYDDDGDCFCEVGPCMGSTSGSCVTIDPDDCNDDVNDGGASTFPGASEVADWRDNNCDQVVDETTCNYDDDGDGFTENGGDCDDADDTESPVFGGTCPPC